MKKTPKSIKMLETQSGAQFDFTQQLLDRISSTQQLLDRVDFPTNNNLVSLLIMDFVG